MAREKPGVVQEILNRYPVINKEPELGVVNYDAVIICAVKSGNDHNAGLVFRRVMRVLSVRPDSAR